MAIDAIVERYDRDAAAYERYWAPVLEVQARALLDHVAPFIDSVGGVCRIVDVGTGSGVLALEAYRRWPSAAITGFDPSVGMLDMARRRALEAGVPADDGRLGWKTGDAATLPLPDASMDLVVSSFVLQLVPDRLAALREARRVLRPGGRLAIVSWRVGGEEFPPGTEFDEAVIDLGVPEPGDADDEDASARSGDFASRRAVADQVRRAGFRRVRARDASLEYVWTLDTYLEFKEHYDDAELFQMLEGPHADRLLMLARERLSRLPPDAFVWRAPIVSVVAERP